MTTVEDIADSGLNNNRMFKLYRRAGEDFIIRFFVAKNANDKPRVTNSKRVDLLQEVIPKLCHNFLNKTT